MVPGATLQLPPPVASSTNGNRLTPPPADPLVRQGRRASRHALTVARKRLTESVSGSLCFTALASAVSVDVGEQLTAHVGGIARCGSPWSCPVCAPVVRQGRAGEIDQALRAHLDGGGGAEFVTLTLRHHRPDRLADRLDVVAHALRLVLTGAPWSRRRDRLGYVGAIRAVEVTWGERNGWHPHVHAALLFERPVSTAERADLRRWMLGRWGAVVEAKGFGTITERNGIDVQAVRSASDLSDYLTKVEGGWGAGLELARGDVKSTRRKGITPLQILARLVETGESRWAALWQEYERATFGKRAIVWSPGLRARLLGTDDEASDEDLAAVEGSDLTLLRRLVERADWNRAVGAGVVGELLDETERLAALLLVLVDLVGGVPAPLDLPGVPP